MSCFNSLQTGKRITRGYKQRDWKAASPCFNSLQTGKRITSVKVFGMLFSFFSYVSIPFKRESVSQASLSGDVGLAREFQFPSNGKAYHKLNLEKQTLPNRSFNSLQTGKRITSLAKSPIWERFQKFQFPSNGKAYHKAKTAKRQQTTQVRFQFPSNGKAYHKNSKIGLRAEDDNVSIPFKRESVSQVTTHWNAAVTELAFQFPSNGKAYHKDTSFAGCIVEVKRFNSLQTGKRITRRQKTHHAYCVWWFQFPSNGKAYHKFKFHWVELLHFSFNSLQTGKRITRYWW